MVIKRESIQKCDRKGIGGMFLFYFIFMYAQGKECVFLKTESHSLESLTVHIVGTLGE